MPDKISLFKPIAVYVQVIQSLSTLKINSGKFTLTKSERFQQMIFYIHNRILGLTHLTLQLGRLWPAYPLDGKGNPWCVTAGVIEKKTVAQCQTLSKH